VPIKRTPYTTPSKQRIAANLRCALRARTAFGGQIGVVAVSFFALTRKE